MPIGKKVQNTLSDQELITKYRFSHDSTYVEELFTRYLPYVYGVSLKNLKNQKDAEEMTLTLYNKVSSDLKRIDVPNFSEWLYNLVKSSCSSEFKKKTASAEESKQILIQELSNEEGGIYLNASSDSKTIDSNKLRLGIDTLNEAQKDCIEHFYIQNKSYQEVAELTGFTINQVKTNIQNGKRLLKSYIDNLENK